MFGPPPGTRVYLACGTTDMRKGFDGLAAQVQTVLAQDPYSGAVFCFRGRRGDLLKILLWDGQGLVLIAKRIEKGKFVWPQAATGVVSLTPAMLSMLLEGIDWRMPAWTARPEGVGQPHPHLERRGATSDHSCVASELDSAALHTDAETPPALLAERNAAIATR